MPMARHENDTSASKVAILVAGMHRSGTSALTRVLNIAGCDLPKTLVNPRHHPGNVAGFWESRAIVALNQEILTSAGSFWDDWRPFDRDWYGSTVADEFRERARQLVRSEFGGSRLFVLKDPRTCRLMTFWIEVLRALDAEPLVVVPIRNPWDAAASLQVRNHIDPSIGQMTWLRHALDAEADSRALRRSFLRYEQLMSDPQAAVDRLGRDLGVSWPNDSPARMEIRFAEFLSPGLHHHKSDDALVLSNPGLEDRVKDSFGIFDRWTLGEARGDDVAELDRIRAAFDESTSAGGHAWVAGEPVNERRVLPDALDSLACLHRAEIVMRGGDWQAAGRLWEELRRAFPDHAAGYVRGAAALMNAGRLDEAERLAVEATERFPDRLGGHYYRAEAAMRRGDWALASERWGALRQAFPDDPSGYVRGAAALMKAGRLDEAEGLAGEAMKRFPDRPGGWAQWGAVAMRRGDWALASERWCELRRTFPHHPSGYVRGAAALMKAGRLDEAEGLAGEAMRRFPGRAGGRVQWAEVAMRRGDWALAIERWGELRRIFPDDPAGYVRGAAALRKAGRPGEAETVERETASRFPERCSMGFDRVGNDGG